MDILRAERFGGEQEEKERIETKVVPFVLEKLGRRGNEHAASQGLEEQRQSFNEDSLEDLREIEEPTRD